MKSGFIQNLLDEKEDSEYDMQVEEEECEDGRKLTNNLKYFEITGKDSKQLLLISALDFH